jgi:hypothetical protein
VWVDPSLVLGSIHFHHQHSAIDMSPEKHHLPETLFIHCQWMRSQCGICNSCGRSRWEYDFLTRILHEYCIKIKMDSLWTVHGPKALVYMTGFHSW